jgi:hypothetical protein
MRKKWTFALLLLGLAVVPVAFCRGDAVPIVQFPEGKRFAFSIVDDTDMAKLERLRTVYAALERYGLKTTKTVWVMEASDLSNSTNQGESLRNPEYRDFIRGLQQKGFEIALHGVRGGSSPRGDVLQGLDEFRDLLGHYPRMQVNHSLNRDNLYWGWHLYDSWPFRLAGAVAIRHEFSGHEPSSEHFWGDVAKERIEYVRRFTYPDINLLAVAPAMPYHLAGKPYVNYWFPTANGDRVIEFNELLSDDNLNRLEREGGVCLVYSHLGSGSFNKGSDIDPRFEARLKALSQRNGWFVPASQILDHLRRQPTWTGHMNYWETIRLDARSVASQLGL